MLLVCWFGRKKMYFKCDLIFNKGESYSIKKDNVLIACLFAYSVLHRNDILEIHLKTNFLIQLIEFM